MTRLRFEMADPVLHAGLLREWLDQPHVAPWWAAERIQETSVYLAHRLAIGHVTPWIAWADDQPFGYVETYRAAEDPLAAAYPLTPNDRGWHVLVGPPQLLGSGLPRLLGRAVLAGLLAERGVNRVVCEPDERNTRMLRFCERLGYSRLATVDLRDKRAALMACTRDEFVRRWPGDLETHGARMFAW